MKTEKCKSESVNIFIAGDPADAKRIIRKRLFSGGLCVSFTETIYMYKGGEEAGYIVGLINYPRFPSADGELFAEALALAETLMNETFQHSCTVQGEKESVFMSLRDWR